MREALRKIRENCNGSAQDFALTAKAFAFARSRPVFFSFVRSPDVKLLLAWLAKVFTGLPHSKVYTAPSGLDNISRKAPEDRPSDDSEASVVRSALAAVAVYPSAELLRNPAHLKFACGEGLDSFLP